MAKELNIPPELISRIETGLLKCCGPDKAVTTKQMIARLKHEGYSNATGPMIRQVIHHLRTHKHLFICGDNKGYYIAKGDAEMQAQLRSMKSRIREISEAYNSLSKTRERSMQQANLFG